MKNVYLSIRNFFLSIWRWIKKQFSSKSETVVESKGDSYGQVQYTNNPVTPKHNNRRTNRGRHTQYVPLRDGTTRAIYHNV
jgi:hypothetical protein